jgi:hypothetical protein
MEYVWRAEQIERIQPGYVVDFVSSDGVREPCVVVGLARGELGVLLETEDGERTSREYLRYFDPRSLRALTGEG